MNKIAVEFTMNNVEKIQKKDFNKTEEKHVEHILDLNYYQI